MTTLRSAYPRSWDEHMTAHADRLALFVEDSVQSLRALRRQEQTFRRTWPLHLHAPAGSVDLLRRLFPGVWYERCGSFYVNRVRVVLFVDSFGDRPSDTFELGWNGVRLSFLLPEVPLTAEQFDLYAQLRRDGSSVSEASELALLLADGRLPSVPA